jgi:hypothetical protein
VVRAAAAGLPAAVGLRLAGAVSSMWTAPGDDPRSYGNPVGDKATYREYLGNYRLTIAMKCEGLDAHQLARRSAPSSTLSLLGLVRHLAQMENHWFQRVLQRRTGSPRLYKGEDDPDWDFSAAHPDPAVAADAFATCSAATASPHGWRATNPRSCCRSGVHYVVAFVADGVLWPLSRVSRQRWRPKQLVSRLCCCG